MAVFFAASPKPGFDDGDWLARFDSGGTGDRTNNHPFVHLDFPILLAFDFHGCFKI
jgi:hypothetical protein